MSFTLLFIIAVGGAFGIIWLINYVTNKPIKKRWYMFSGKGYFSLRLFICKFLAPFDAGMTIFLIAGGMLGISITGLGTFALNILLGLGISAGVVITKKFFIPRWKKAYNIELRELLKAQQGEEFTW